MLYGRFIKCYRQNIEFHRLVLFLFFRSPSRTTLLTHFSNRTAPTPAKMTMADDAVAATTAPRKRNQYNLEFKLEVANQYAPGVAGRGFESLAREYGLSKSNVMHWVAKKELIAERLAAAGGGGAACNTFRLDGCGRKSAYSDLEDELEQWVILQTAQGERVKDNAMKERAIQIFREMHVDGPADSASAFKASSGWLARFKQRKNLALRRPSKASEGEEDGNSAEAAALMMQQRLVQLEREARAAASVAPVITPVVPATAPAVTLIAATVVAANRRKSAVAFPPAAIAGVERHVSVPPAAPVSSATQAPSPATRAPVQAPPVPAPTPQVPAVGASMQLVSLEWMQSVSQQFSDLSQKVAHLVEGQNMLLGMLQRLQAPQPVRVVHSGGSYTSSPARNGFLSPQLHQQSPFAYGTIPAAAQQEAYDEGQELQEHDSAPPPAKRRRVSILKHT